MIIKNVQHANSRFRSAVLLKQDMRRNVSSKFIADVYEGNWKWIKVSQNSLLKANHISTETIKKIKNWTAFCTNQI